MERRVREFLATYKIDKINTGLEELMNEMKNDVRYLVLYPLVYLEENVMSKESVVSIHNQIDRASLSWFLTKIENKERFEITKKFHNVQYEKFKQKLVPRINQLYQEYRQYCEICDHWSFARSKIDEIDTNRWKYTSSLVTNKYSVETFYYNRLFEPWMFEFENEQRIIINLDFHKAAFLDLGNKTNYNNTPLKEASLFLVNQDFRFLGTNPVSKVIDDIEAFKLLISALQFLARMRLAKNNIVFEMTNSYNLEELVMCFELEELGEKCSSLMNIDREKVDRYINYLSLQDKGSLFEFPLVKLNNKILFNPSGIILNDWHFSYVNGHYAKKIDFIERDNMISTQVIDIINDIVKLDENLLVEREHYYEFIENGKTENSDIDYAIYDPIKDALIVLECKWKDNHYVSEVDYNNIKIQMSLFDIYNKQIAKHKKFIENYNGMSSLFKKQLNVPSKILYLGIDKRNQLYFENEKMTSVYMFSTLLLNSIENDMFNIDFVIDEINSLRTKTEYLYFEDRERIIKTDFNVDILTDEL